MYKKNNQHTTDDKCTFVSNRDFSTLEKEKRYTLLELQNLNFHESTVISLINSGILSDESNHFDLLIENDLNTTVYEESPAFQQVQEIQTEDSIINL
jgi:hypothetical protein